MLVRFQPAEHRQKGLHMAKALVVVDVQNDFISGTLPVPNGEQVAVNIHNLLTSPFVDTPSGAGGKYDIVVTTQDWHIDPGDHWSDTPDYVDSWPVHCEAGTAGADLHPALQVLADEYNLFDYRLYKGEYEAAYSGFEASDPDLPGLARRGLQAILDRHNINEVHVCGLATDYCVKQTALDAARLGYEVFLLTNFSAGITEESTAAAIEEMRDAGVHII